MWLRLRWQNLYNELLLFEQSVNLKTFVVVISVLALRCSSCYNLSSQPQLYLPFRTLIQDLHIKAICILKISSPNFHVIIYCIYMTKIEQIRKTPCLSLHVIESLCTSNTWEMYIWCFNTCTWLSHAISENSSGPACRQGPWSAVLGYFHACVKWTYIQSNSAISNSVNSKSPLFRRKIEFPWIYPSPLRFPGYFETPLFWTFFHFPWDFEIAGFDCTDGRLSNLLSM